MSTVKTDTLANVAGTKSAPVGDLADGRCTAWVNFNGVGTVAIRDSFNVSSITDNGVGLYTVNFATAMANVNYSALANSVRPTVFSFGAATRMGTCDTFVASSVGVKTYYLANTTAVPVAEDGDVISAAVFGGV